MILTSLSVNAQEKSIAKVQEELGFELSETNKRFYEETGLVRCASYEYNENLRTKGKLSPNDEFENFMRKAIAKEKEDMVNGRAATIYTIPVVVHVYHKGEAVGTGTNVSDAVINSQITVLNQDFRRMTGTPGHNTNPVGADTEIQFCLAKVDPNGAATTGITRRQGIAGSYTTGTFDAEKPNSQWDPTKYLNIWVADLGASLLGYAQFPHANGVISGMTGGYAGGNSNTDGVVMGPNYFGSSDITTVSGSAPYDKGRTTTHEVGHWLGLKHITGDSACGNDECADTPTQENQSNQAVGCNPTTTCGSQDMIQNYMDYTNDACMNIFTQDQTARMRAILNPANNIVNRGSLVQAGTTHTLCSTTPDFNIVATNSPVSISSGTASAVFNFNFSALNGYNTNTAFSVTNGLPAGANATFNPTSMNANGTFTLTIGNLSAVPAGNYTITVSAAGSTTKTVDVVLTIGASCSTIDSTQNNVTIPTAATNGTEAAPAESTINITNNIQITDVNVTLNINYEYVEDLRVVLTGPDNTSVELIKNIPSNSGNHFTNTVLDDAGSTAIQSTAAAAAPFTGTYSPASPLSAFNGKTSLGDWKLSVYDNWVEGNGTLLNWKLELCGTPVLSIEDQLIKDSFSVWPNPSNGNVNISFNAPNNKDVIVKLYDIRGRLISNQTFTNNESTFNKNLRFNNLEQAIYILKVNTGSTEITKRLVIK
ncbi:M43 family zinc metalloprotease [Pseudofulvibacter geojedonensis]